jgi:histidinol dehydrogenase
VRRLGSLSDDDRRLILDRARAAVFDDDLHDAMSKLLADVRANGDDAVVRALAQFDGVTAAPHEQRGSDDEFDAAEYAIEPAVREAIVDAIGNLRRYNERQLEGANWRAEIAPGIRVGEQANPIASAALFVPNGKGSFPSVLMMLGTPAVVAGVREITVLVPPTRGQGLSMDPAVVFAAKELGLRNVLRANGPAGIAAVSCGTETFPRVGRVVGPGSPAVAAMQIQVQRYGCSTVMAFGPSESIIIADDGANPLVVAADMLNEAEHGPDSASLLVTPSEELADAVGDHIEALLAELPQPRRDYASSSISKFGGVMLVSDLDEAVEFTNEYAPEHLQVNTESPEELVPKLVHAGEILLGGTPIIAANFSLGVPATLPTGSFARFSSGVTARTFQKVTSIADATPQAIERLGPGIIALAIHEGFPAHANSIRLRLDGNGARAPR